jgi:hypothetical protein
MPNGQGGFSPVSRDDVGAGWNVVFAIVGGWREVTITALPLLARIALRDACQRLADFGFNPVIKLVGT